MLGASMAHLQGYSSVPQTPFSAMLSKHQQRQSVAGMNGSSASNTLLIKRSSAKEVSGERDACMGISWLWMRLLLGNVYGVDNYGANEGLVYKDMSGSEGGHEKAVWIVRGLLISTWMAIAFVVEQRKWC